MISPAAREYLKAFDEYLAARVDSRDTEFASIWKREALRTLIEDTGRDPDKFLSEIPLEPRGKQNTPRSNEKRLRRRRRRATASPKEGA